MKNKRMILVVIVPIIVFIIIFLIVNYIYKSKTTESENIQSNEISIDDKNVINEIKTQINATADSDMYQIEEEYDGRKILQIKPNIQLETVLAGILKNGEPLENEIETILQDRPTKSGIWISKQAREKFLYLLTDNNIENYAISSDGYLYEEEEVENKLSNKLKNAINSNKLYIIDMNGTSYVRDDMTGEIVEYPFEKMEPYQIIDTYEDENQVILEITTNEKGKLSNNEILNEILDNLE